MSDIIKPKLLSPAGDWPSLRAAVEAGADEVYFGLKQLSMRAFAKNFDITELPKLVQFCKEHNVKTNLTINTIIYDEELGIVHQMIKTAKDAGVDAVICWDQSILQICKENDMTIHISTQASVSNTTAAKFYKDLGVKRIIFARELNLEQLKKIKQEVPGIEVETFCHGAMCVSISGRCFMSQELFGKSANRGECIQPCRREYKVSEEKRYNLKDIDKEFELTLGQDYVMSPKDMCTLPFLEKLTDTIDVLKIEGRMRSPEYVKTTTECYRQAIDAIEENKFTEDLKQELLKKLRTVYNRDFSAGFFLGKPINEWTDAYGSKATKQKIFIGVVKNYFEKPGAAEVHLRSGSIKVGDMIMFQGNKTGVQEQTIGSIQINGKEVKSAEKGKRVGISVDKKVRPNDKVFILKDK